VLEGEIMVRGPLVMDGIYKHERFETFTPDGWYPTGDRGWFDDEGSCISPAVVLP
jgi:long-subunit acyl-CoA synthetase (AMP-forming)